MYYILIMDGRVQQNIPKEDSMFPGIPVESRYSKDLLDQCVKSLEPVPEGWIYDSDTGTFSEPPKPEVPDVPPEPEPPEPPEPMPNYTELLEAIRILTGGADDELDW